MNRSVTDATLQSAPINVTDWCDAIRKGAVARKCEQIFGLMPTRAECVSIVHRNPFDPDPGLPVNASAFRLSDVVADRSQGRSFLLAVSYAGTIGTTVCDT